MLVWYAAFGSNVLRERFLRYLHGGPVPGSGRIQNGARDASDPQDDQPFRVDREMGFGFESPRWHGAGISFVDPYRVVPGDTLGRAWLVTVEQLADVWAQENGGAVGPTIDLSDLVRSGSADLGRGWYRRLEYLGDLDGAPVATITCQTVPVANAAGDAYLEVVGQGLIETWSMAPSEAATYLATRPGNHGVVDPDALTERLEP